MATLKHVLHSSHPWQLKSINACREPLMGLKRDRETSINIKLHRRENQQVQQ